MSKPIISDFNRVAQTLTQKYERYIPTAYDESMSLLEKVNRTILFLNQIGELTNNVVEQWNQVMEWVLSNGINEEVVYKLNKMFETGELASIINETIFDDLNTTVNDMKDTLQNTLNDFSFVDKSPSFFRNLKLKHATIMQTFVYNYETKEFFVTQVSPEYNDPAQSYTISRLTDEGELKDSMTLIHGGHGTNIGVENTPEGVIIWSPFDIVDPNKVTIGHDLVSFKYTPNVTIDENSHLLKRYNKFTALPAMPTIDQKNDLIAFRLGSDVSQIIEIRKLSDVKQNIDNLLHSFTIPIDLKYTQGFSIDGDYFYWYTGDTNSVQFPREITKFDVRTGTIIERKTVSFGKNAQGFYENDFVEPEGVFLFTHPLTGAKSLLAGVVTGNASQRKNKIYGYHSLQNESFFLGQKSQAIQNFQLTDNSGYRKNIPVDATKLSDIKDAGFYYLSTDESSKLIDHPAQGVSGWFLDVSPPSWEGTFTQTLYRISTHRNNTDIYYKTYSGSAGSTWEQINGSPKWKNIPLQSGFTAGATAPQLAFTHGGTGVSLRGFATFSGAYSAGMVLGIIPEQFRPTEWVYLTLPIDNGTGNHVFAYINSAGEIKAYSNIPADVKIIFDNIVYYVN